MRLHIGGTEVKAGWKILDMQPGPGVDYIGDCSDLSRIADGSVEEIYASHVLEHLGYVEKLPRALAELHRVLKKGGSAMISVPDLDVLCRLFIDPRMGLSERILIMRMAFGGQPTRTISTMSDWPSTFSATFWELPGFRRSNGRAISAFSTTPARCRLLGRGSA